jgi:hypothetical protein
MPGCPSQGLTWQPLKADAPLSSNLPAKCSFIEFHAHRWWKIALSLAISDRESRVLFEPWFPTLG